MRLDKRLFISRISKNIKRGVKVAHINSVVNLLCEFLFQELKDQEEFAIHNFGTFLLKKNKPRKYFDVLDRKIKISKGNRLLKFKLNRKLRKKISTNVDLNG